MLLEFLEFAQTEVDIKIQIHVKKTGLPKLAWLPKEHIYALITLIEV